MRTLRFCCLALIVLVACQTTVTLGDELARKEDNQRGPKVVLSRGKLPDGQPWIFYAYRSAGTVICIRHSWLQKDGLRESEGTCSPPEGLRKVQSSVTFPRVAGEELRYYVGLVGEDRSVTVRWRLGSKTQDLPVLRNGIFGNVGFTIAHLELPSAPTTIELLDASGNVLDSEAFHD